MRISSRYLIFSIYAVFITCLYVKLCKVFFLDSPNLTICSHGIKHIYNRYSDLLFIVGFPRSGTTVFKSMIEEHPEIKCGRESRLIPSLLDKIRDKWTQEKKILYGDSVSQFILNLLAKRPTASRILCNKVPELGLHIAYLRYLFPAAKFLLLVRDGRAAARSFDHYKFIDFGINLPYMTDYGNTLIQWNNYIKDTLEQCLKVGYRACLIVFYELFVNDREFMLHEIANFLDIQYADWAKRERLAWKSYAPFDERFNRSHPNISHEISNSSFYTWMSSQDTMPRTAVQKLVPMLGVFGYDTIGIVPDYSVETMRRAYWKILKCMKAKNFFLKAEQSFNRVCNVK